MRYQLHDVDRELWAFTKMRAHLEEMTLNDYIIALLRKNKYYIDADDKLNIKSWLNKSKALNP